MTKRQGPEISSRKRPQQARSTELVASILQAATEVLASEGATRFTTARVAERAGVSVGSVYQYFPNKASILFALQAEEWAQTTEMLRRILQDSTRQPLERLRSLVHAFITSEVAEAPMRQALNDAAPLYRDAPEAREIRESANDTIAAFMAEVLPKARPATRSRAGDLVMTTLSTVGGQFSETPRNKAEIKAYADAMGDMFCAYLERAAVP